MVPVDRIGEGPETFVGEPPGDDGEVVGHGASCRSGGSRSYTNHLCLPPRPTGTWSHTLRTIVQGFVVAEDAFDRELTAAALRDQAEDFAAHLVGEGIEPGSVVAWQLPSSIEAIVVLAGLARVGAVQVPLVPIYRRREVSFVAAQTGATLLIVPSEFRGFDHAGLAREVAAGRRDLDVMVLDRGGLPHRSAAAVAALPEPGHDDQAARWVFYTSGTVADPKGARHSDATLIAAAAGYAARLGFTASDRSGVTFPLSHVGGPTSLATTLLTGMTMVLAEVFDPERTPEQLADAGVTLVSGPGIVHQAFVDAQRRHGADRAFPRLRAFLGGGAPKPPGLSAALRDEVGAPLLSGYGATESPLATFCVPDDDVDVLDHTEGRPIDGVHVRVVDADDRLLGPGEEGELRLAGPQRFLGYLDPALDAEAFDEAGFFRSGDLGYLDGRGNLVVTGRLKEIIIRKGENLSAREIQDVLLRHPGVADAVVIGLPDASSGERACAIVVPRPSGAPFDAAAMAAHCRDQGLMNQKIPEQLEIVDELPRNAMGKVMVAALRERFGTPVGDA